MSQELFTAEDIEAILGSVNVKRLAPYIEFAEYIEEIGAKLYLWNMQISSSFWFAFHILEVTLRNSIDIQMKIITNNDDWLNDKLLHEKEINKVLEARKKLHNHQKSVTHDKTIAELNFGFWLSLFQRNYHKALWEAGLYKCFPNYEGKRSEIYQTLEILVRLRNRIAHHEPIFKNDLEEQFVRLVGVVSYMNSNLAGLIVRNSDVINYLNNYPIKIVDLSK